VFHVSVWELGPLFGRLSSPKPPRGEGTEQTMDKN